MNAKAEKNLQVLNEALNSLTTLDPSILTIEEIDKLSSTRQEILDIKGRMMAVAGYFDED